MEIKEFAKKLIEESGDLVDDIELSISTGKSLEYELKNEDIAPNLSLDQASIGIRVLKDGALGSSAITRLDLDEAMIAIDKALNNMKPTLLKSFSYFEDIPEIENFDPEILKMFDKPNELRQIAEKMQKRLYDNADKLESFEGSVGIMYGERQIATKHGSAYSQETVFSAFAEINSADFDFVQGSFRPKDFEKVSDLALKLYNELPDKFVTPAELGIDKEKMEVILDPLCLESILRTLLGEKIYGSSKLNNLTELEPGQQVADKSLTLIDTGINDKLSTSSPTDDEGYASRENVIIGDGKFKQFIYDALTALKAGTKSTGNGLRRPILVEDSNEAPVRESLRGLYVKAGNKSYNELLASIDKGIYVKSLLGLHGADKSRASFVAGVHIGRSIENGKLARLLAPGVWNLGANLFDLDGRKGMLNEIEISREQFNTGSAILPWVKFRLSM